MNLIELVATTAPSDMFFAIGEQINALMGLILCLMAMWNRMENPKLTGGIILAAGTIWFILSGFICGMFRIPTLWTVFPTGIVAVLVFSKVTNLTVSYAAPPPTWWRSSIICRWSWTWPFLASSR